MGWKNVKEHYRIGHIVHVKEGIFLIGSPYISDIVRIAPDGTFLKRYGGSNEDLVRYQEEIEADLDVFSRLFSEPDSFGDSIPVYTYDGADIIEKSCEGLGWPNVTHDGELMYDNTFFAKREDAVDRARSNAEAGVELLRKALADAEESALKYRKLLAEQEDDVSRLLEGEGIAS